MTHGFCVDENGRKMSKSIGNVIDPRDIIEGGKDLKKFPPYGADTLRLWVASVDYTGDVAISPEIMANIGKNAAMIRNRARFMLGNVFDFDPKSHATSFDSLPMLDRHIVCEAEAVFQEITESYNAYAFGKATKALIAFLQELSSLYFELAKDRLYISSPNSMRRRSCQSVLRWLAENLARVLGPVTCHMAEDIWQALPGAAADKGAESVFLAGWVTPFPGREGRVGSKDEGAEAYRNILKVRETCNVALEKVRKAGDLGLSFEAHAHVAVASAGEAALSLRRSLEVVAASPHQDVDSLRWLLGVSQADTDASAPAPAAGELLAVEANEESGVTVSVSRAAGTKCERCYIHCSTVGTLEAHKPLCARCAAVVDEWRAGQGQLQAA